MRLKCEVETVNRALASHNMKKPSRGCHAQVSVGRKPGGGKQLYVMVCTAKDRNGMKYLVKDNVSQMFVKFVSEGKATIRFKEPEQDLCLSKADPVQLKGFLSLVRAASQGNMLERVTLAALAPASQKQVEKPRSDLTITSRKEYPLSSSFPSSLTALTVNSCGMKRLDPRILQLSRLTRLDLSHNQLSALPEDWGRLTGLTCLTLAHNQLTTLPVSFSQLALTLTSLDLRHNQISNLPLHICELKQLMCLKVDNNGLKLLAPTIGKLTRLRELSIAQNDISKLPAGFAQLRLDTLDVSDNPLDSVELGVSGAERLSFPTLLECVARAIRKQRVPYTQEDLFPHLFHYLGAARQCWCGNYCFSCSARYVTAANLRTLVSHTYTASPGIESVPLEGFLCSQYCLSRYQTNPRAYWRRGTT